MGTVNGRIHVLREWNQLNEIRYYGKVTNANHNHASQPENQQVGFCLSFSLI